MEKNIRFSGITADTSDYNASDGHLSVAVNLVVDSHGLVPFLPPRKLFQMEYGTLRFLHKTSQYNHYIVETSENDAHALCLYNPDSSLPIPQRYTSIHVFDTGVAIHEVNAIGNTIVVLASDGIHYILWQSSSLSYVYLGQKPPELDVRFSLSYPHPDSYDISSITDDDSVQGDGRKIDHPYRKSSVDARNAVLPGGNFKASEAHTLNDSVWALVNSANALVASHGRFYAPFFVRYCYRLYDGSMFMQSVPIFMPLSSPFSYLVFNLHYTHDFSLRPDPSRISIDLWPYDDSDNPVGGKHSYPTDGKMSFGYLVNNMSLQYSLRHLDASVADTLERWKDIVSSVDIFVSPPFVRERNDEPIQGLTDRPYQLVFDDKEYNVQDVWNTGQERLAAVRFPLEDEDSYLKRLTEVNTFYKACSIPLNDVISDIRDDVDLRDAPIKEGVLSVLATQEAMDDDFKTHSQMLPVFDEAGRCLSSLFPYNARLNASCLKERLHPFPLHALVPRFSLNHSDDLASDENGESLGEIVCTDMLVTLKTSEGMKYVRHEGPAGFSDGTGFFASFYYLLTSPIFYPDTRASSMTLHLNAWRTDSSGIRSRIDGYLSLDMSPSPFLNAAYTTPLAIASFQGLSWLPRRQDDYRFPEPSICTGLALKPLLDDDPPVSFIPGHDTISYTNKIYTSAIENPFYFPPSSINTVGTGTIIGLSSAAKALSQGQFGQFPLYAFTDEGVWALSVSANGGYSSIQPFCRDVCIDKSSITQLDSSVIFVSQRGLMLIAGSETSCISDTLQAKRNFNTIAELRNAHQLLSLAGLDHDACPDRPFLEFLDGAHIMYIYTRRAILIYRPDTRYAYIYSVATQYWSMSYAIAPIASHVNSYPDAIAQRIDPVNYSDGTVDFVTNVYDYSSEDYRQDSPSNGTTHTRGLLLTRPLNLDLPNTLKTISGILLRGDFDKGHAQMALYASRDLRNWIYVNSSVDHFLRGFRGTPYKYFRLAVIFSLSPDESIYGASIQFATRLTNQLR